MSLIEIKNECTVCGLPIFRDHSPFVFDGPHGYICYKCAEYDLQTYLKNHQPMGVAL